MQAIAPPAASLTTSAATLSAVSAVYQNWLRRQSSLNGSAGSVVLLNSCSSRNAAKTACVLAFSCRSSSSLAADVIHVLLTTLWPVPGQAAP